MKNKLLILLLLLSISLPAYAIKWEKVVEFNNNEGSAKVFIDRQRIKSRKYKGDKYISYWMKSELSNKTKPETAKSTNQYEVNCNTKEAYKLQGELQYYKKGQMVSQAKVIEPEKLQGKEYYDNQDLMNKLCSEY